MVLGRHNDVIDRDAHIHVGSAFPTGPISTGYHKTGFYYGQDELVWYIDGYPVQVEDCLVPDTDMYLVLSREMNTGLTLDNAAIDNEPGAIFNTSSDPVIHKEIFIDGGLLFPALSQQIFLNVKRAVMRSIYRFDTKIGLMWEYVDGTRFSQPCRSSRGTTNTGAYRFRRWAQVPCLKRQFVVKR